MSNGGLKNCPCCNGSGSVNPSDIGVLKIQLLFDRKEKQRPLILKTSESFALTELQHCKNTEIFFKYKGVFKNKKKRLLICKDLGEC